MGFFLEPQDLYHTILCYTILYYTILYYTILYYTILYYTILYYTILYCTVLYYNILYKTRPDQIRLDYLILDYTLSYYTVPYYTLLYSTTSLYYTGGHQIVIARLDLNHSSSSPFSVQTPSQHHGGPKPKSLQESRESCAKFLDRLRVTETMLHVKLISSPAHT